MQIGFLFCSHISESSKICKITLTTANETRSNKAIRNGISEVMVTTTMPWVLRLLDI